MKYPALSPTLATLAPGAHVGWIYETENQHQDMLLQFIQHSLNRSEKVLYIFDNHASAEVTAFLQNNGVEIDSHLNGGRLSAVPAEDVFLQDGAFDPQRMITLLQREANRAETEGYSALMVTGEMTWALRKLANSRRLIEYEAKLNDFFAAGKCLVVCQYDRRRFYPELLLDVLATHPIIVNGSEVHDNIYYMPPQEFVNLEWSEIELNGKLKQLAQLTMMNSALHKSEQRMSELCKVNEKLERENKDLKRIEVALQNSEVRFRTVFECAGIGMALLNLDGRPVMNNSALQKMLGYQSKELCRMPISKLAHPADRAMDASLYEELISGKRDQYQFEKQFICKDGSHVWGQTTVSLIRGSNAEPKFAIAMIQDISERKKAEEEIKSSHAQLRNLSTHLQTATEAERKKIAREIHDELGQTLTALKIDLAWIENRLPPKREDLNAQAQSMSKLIDGTIQKVRKLAMELRPDVLDNLGLTAAIEWQVEEVRKRAGLKYDVQFEPNDIAIDQNRSIDIFRILQETLTNIIRHSQASKVYIHLQQKEDKVVLTVQDNGRGIASGQIADHRSIGLIGMRERARKWGGEIKITGIRNKGTTVMVTLPLNGVE
jgi:PAS domain S-box-containing protein